MRGRVLEIPYGTVDKVAKLIPEGPKVYLDDCLKPGAELKQAYDADPLVKEIVDLAKPLEGLVRQDSIHAAGVVISDRPLTDVVPLQQKGADQEVVTQFGMWDVEALGLLKMDFLGLRNLDVIDKAVELVGNGLDIAKIPMDDAKTYKMLAARGMRRACSSSSRRGMREALRQVQADRVRRPDRARCSVSAGADGLQSRPTRSGRTARSRSRSATRALEAITGVTPRDLHLPRAVPRDREADRRLHAGRGRTTCGRRSARRSTS